MLKENKVQGSRRSRRLNNTEIQMDDTVLENIYFDPIISLYFLFRESLLSEMWTVRQYSCANLISLHRIINIKNSISQIPEFWEVENLIESLETDLATRTFLLTLMDQFSDYQEHRLIPLVRQLSVKLLASFVHIIPIHTILELAGSILISKKLYWMYKYNVLLIIKTIMTQGKAFQSQNNPEKSTKQVIIEDQCSQLKTFKIFEHVWKWLKSEDEVKILAWECIEELIDAIGDSSANDVDMQK
jgi:hypothetical protein